MTTDTAELKRLLSAAEFGRFELALPTTGAVYILDDNFKHDAGMGVSGDWADREEAVRYAEAVCAAVNAAPALIEEVDRLTSERDTARYEARNKTEAWENCLAENERLRARLAQVEETHPPEGYPGIAHDMETLRAENAKLADAHLGQMQRGNDLFVECESLRAALRIIAGQEQCIDNLMSNVDVARAALTPKETP